jgi:hypothetical protein
VLLGRQYVSLQTFTPLFLTDIFSLFVTHGIHHSITKKLLFPSQVIGGIKTVSSLCAEIWAVNKYVRSGKSVVKKQESLVVVVAHSLTHSSSSRRYEGMAREAQKHAIYAGILSKLAAGTMGILFYAMYTMAFIFGTYVIAILLNVLVLFLLHRAIALMSTHLYCIIIPNFREQVAETVNLQNSKKNPFYCMINYCGITGSEVMVYVSESFPVG